MEAFPDRLDVTDRPGVALRILQPDDWRLEFELGRVEDVPPWTMYPADIDETVARLRARRNVESASAGRGVRYVVEEDGVPLGTAGFGRSDAGFEIFYAMKPEGRGRGLMTDAVRTLAAWLTGQGESVVWLSTLNGNAPSEGVARRCGFVPFREGTHVDGRRVTVWRMTA